MIKISYCKQCIKDLPQFTKNYLLLLKLYPQIEKNFQFRISVWRLFSDSNYQERRRSDLFANYVVPNYY